MSINADGSTVTEPIANGGVTPEMKQEFQKVVMGILKDAMPRMMEQSMAKLMPALLEKVTAETPRKDEPTTAKPPKDTEGGSETERGALRALQNQLNELKQQNQKATEELQAERQRVIDTQMRGEVQSALAAKLGADNPSLGFLMDSLYDTRKRFVRGENGETLVKFKSAYGDDEMLSLSDGVKKLTESELKSMLPSATQNLPGIGRGGRGSPVPSNGVASNPLDRIMSDVVGRAIASPADPTQK